MGRCADRQRGFRPGASDEFVTASYVSNPDPGRVAFEPSKWIGFSRRPEQLPFPQAQRCAEVPSGLSPG
jgi:hypothetical protein